MSVADFIIRCFFLLTVFGASLLLTLVTLNIRHSALNRKLQPATQTEEIPEEIEQAGENIVQQNEEILEKLDLLMVRLEDGRILLRPSTKEQSSNLWIQLENRDKIKT